MPFTEELDEVYESCFKPTLEANGLKPIVVSRDRDGSPVYSQIISNIQSSYLIVADLTIARPNCYFEVGYAIGQGKQDNLIMCCREDHLTDSPNNPRQKSKTVLVFNFVKDFLPKSGLRFLYAYVRPVLDQHKIHFDLSGYNILWWNRINYKKFVSELDTEIKRRIEILKMKEQMVDPAPAAATVSVPTPDVSDVEIQRTFAEIELKQREELKKW
jgi:hypothetical protein